MMTPNDFAGNHTIFGASIPAFAAAVDLLHRDPSGDALWSSVCDKKGDWMISTGDDGLTPDLLVKLIAIPGVFRVVKGGEIATMIEDHPEYDGLYRVCPALWTDPEYEAD